MQKKVSNDNYDDETRPFPHVGEPVAEQIPLRDYDVEIPVTFEGASPKEMFQNVVNRVVDDQKKLNKGDLAQQKSKDTSNKSAKWSAVMNMARNTNLNAKTFFGLGENVQASRHKWDERTLRAMKNNRFFGGAIDPDALKDYIQTENFDETDDFYL